MNNTLSFKWVKQIISYLLIRFLICLLVLFFYSIYTIIFNNIISIYFSSGLPIIYILKKIVKYGKNLIFINSAQWKFIIMNDLIK